MVIGVVFRGNKELDGVLSTISDVGLEEAISKMLLESKHHGQVRVILMEQKGLPVKIDPMKIWEKTGKPVLLVSEEVEFDSRFMFHYLGNVFIAAGIDEESARRVLDKIFPDSRSEALRIAGIILESISVLHNV